MKTLIIAVMLIIKGVIIDFIAEIANSTGMILQIIGIASLAPTTIKSLKKDISDIKIGDKIYIEYWRRTRCGTDEESMDLFQVKGTVDDIVKLDNTRLFCVYSEKNNRANISQSTIEKIKFL